MLFPRQILIDYLTVFRNLLSIGFGEKKALELLAYYFQHNVSYCQKITADINKGLSVVQAINNRISIYSDFIYDCNSIALKPWLTFRIDELQKKNLTYIALFRMSFKPLVLFSVVIILNGFILTVLFPKLLVMLDQFNTPIPAWLVFLNQVLSIIYDNILMILILGGSCFVIGFSFIKQFIFYLIKPIKMEWILKEFLETMRALHNQGMQLKQIVMFIRIRKTSIYRSRFDTFKRLITEDHSFENAFHCLLNNPHHELIINHGITSNTFHDALTHLITYYQDRFLFITKRVVMVVNGVLFVLTAIIIILGFYIILQPLMQVIQFAL